MHDKIIKKYLVLLPSIIRKYAKHSPNEYDDLRGIAYLALVEIINKNEVLKMCEYEQSRFICSHVHWALRIFLAENKTVIRRPRASNSQKFKAPKINTLLFEPLAKSDTSYELREILGKIAKSALEKRILCQRIQGYTDREIAKQLNYTPAYIGRIRALLEERFDKLWN